MEETFESIDRDTNEKLFYYLAFVFVAIQVISSFYLLIFEMFILFLRTITFSLDDISAGENVFLNINPLFILIGVGGGTIASFIFGFFDKLRLTGIIIMILLAGSCNVFVFFVIQVDNDKELAILSAVLSMVVLIFIMFYFRKRKKKLAVKQNNF
ncbi:MAG: hypothetical protein P8Y43_05520 [Sulfurovaceae bacterium]